LNLASYIDHTLLRPNATKNDIQQLCEEALEFDFHSVCIPPFFVAFADRLLRDSDVAVCTVAGFPAGFDYSDTKELSVSNSINNGAREIDIVTNVAAVTSGNWELVQAEIRQLGNICRQSDVIFKCIFEVSLLKYDDLELLCGVVNDEGVDFAKTSTGVYGTGATPTEVMQMRRLLNREIRIKASGGIRTRHSAIQLIRAGADRLGTSRGIDIINNMEET
jgi:deoxyribose-phosphate aldolase